jgi:hypothetical protein
LPFPTGKATSRYREVRACTQRVFCKRLPAAQPSASRCRETIRRTTPPPSGNTSPTTELLETEQLSAKRNTYPASGCIGTKRLKRI